MFLECVFDESCSPKCSGDIEIVNLVLIENAPETVERRKLIARAEENDQETDPDHVIEM